MKNSNNISTRTILPSYRIPSDEQSSPIPLPTPTTPKLHARTAFAFQIPTHDDRITLFTKFSNDGVFFAGEKLTCSFTFVPPGYQTLVPAAPAQQPPASKVQGDEEEAVRKEKASDIQKRLPASPEVKTEEGGLLSWFWPFSTASSPTSPVAENSSPMMPEDDRAQKTSIVDSQEMLNGDGVTENVIDSSKPSNVGIDENPLKIPPSVYQGNDCSLALAFVQLVGYLSYDPSLVKLPPDTEQTRLMLGAAGGAGVSLSEIHNFILESKSVPVLLSSPSVLFANLDLGGHKEPPKKRCFEFEAILPPVVPPSHRGRAFRIQYRLILGIQKSIYDKPHFIHLPFRVFGLVHGNDYFVHG